MVLKKIFLFIALIHSSFLLSQLHHQTISSQSSNSTSSGYHVFQSIGQLSPIGNFSSNKQNVFQGFQQPLLRKLYIQNLSYASVLTYPNPFENEISFQFISKSPKNLEISIFDLNGKLVKQLYKELNGLSILKLYLEDLRESSYIINMKGFNFLYSTIIVKQ